MTNIKMDIKYKLLGDTIIAKQATSGSAGLDLQATLQTPLSISPNTSQIIHTSLAIELPLGYCAMICSRSGLAAKHGLFVLNAPGIIDSDYRGEIKVILHNSSSKEFIVTNGMKIAQMLIIKHEIVKWIQAKELSETERNEGGFGSTGL